MKKENSPSEDFIKAVDEVIYARVRTRAAKIFDDYVGDLMSIVRVESISHQVTYNANKKIFVNIIISHFEKNPTIIRRSVANPKLSILGQPIEEKPVHFTESSEKEIDRIISAYADAALIFSINFIEIFEPTVKKRLLNLKEKFHKLKSKYTNRKGKEWREELYKLGKEEYKQNKYLNKTTALKTAFEKLPDKELYRAEFDLKFKSISEIFRKKV